MYNLKNPDYKGIAEYQVFKRLLETYPTGILSVVSDTFDLFKVVTEYLPRLKQEILARDGKLVIRPDSGDPVDILCGEAIDGNLNYDNSGRAYPDNSKGWDKVHKNGAKYYKLVGDNEHKEWCEITPEPKDKGVIELLWDVFGGTVNEQGYKVLDSHIGAIYGDSITLERANQICDRLEKKGFASTNVVFGVGSFTYQYNTRDTFGFAMKATYVELTQTVNDSGIGETGTMDKQVTVGINIFKDPITDDGTKKSATGLLTLYDNYEGGLTLIDKASWETENKGKLQTIYKDGRFNNITTLTQIRERLKINK